MIAYKIIPSFYKTIASYWLAQKYHVYGGNPNSSGTKSCRERKTVVAFSQQLLGTFSSGTITTCMPAAIADLTPLGASSKTRT